MWCLSFEKKKKNDRRAIKSNTYTEFVVYVESTLITNDCTLIIWISGLLNYLASCIWVDDLRKWLIIDCLNLLFVL